MASNKRKCSFLLTTLILGQSAIRFLEKRFFTVGTREQVWSFLCNPDFHKLSSSKSSDSTSLSSFKSFTFNIFPSFSFLSSSIDRKFRRILSKTIPKPLIRNFTFNRNIHSRDQCQQKCVKLESNSLKRADRMLFLLRDKYGTIIKRLLRIQRAICCDALSARIQFAPGVKRGSEKEGQRALCSGDIARFCEPVRARLDEYTQGEMEDKRLSRRDATPRWKESWRVVSKNSQRSRC